MKKRIVSLVLTLTLMLSLGITAFAFEPYSTHAADKTLTVGSVVADPGDNFVVIPVTLAGNAGAEGGIAGFALRAVLPEGVSLVGTYTSFEDYDLDNGTSYEATYPNAKWTGYLVSNSSTLNIIGANAENKKTADGTTLFYMVLAVADTMVAGEHQIGLIPKPNDSGAMLYKEGMDEKNIAIVTQCQTTIVNGTLTVNSKGEEPETPEEPEIPEEPADYALSLSASQTVTAGGDYVAAITVSAVDKGEATKTSFNAVDFILSYGENLSYKSVSEGYTATEIADGVRITGYGEDKSFDTPIYITFTANSTGELTLRNAKVDEASNAISQDMPDADILNASVTVTVPESFSITLPDIFTGNGTVAPDEPYTFSETDHGNFDYSAITVTMGGEDITADLVNNGDGSYTIPAVTADVTVTATRTPKTRNVSFTYTGIATADEVIGAATASYGTDYSFTLSKAPQHSYTVSMSVGGVAYTSFAYDGNTGTYTIPGTSLTGDVAVTINKEFISVGSNVSFSGTGAGDLAGATTASNANDYTFSLTRQTGYVYTDLTVTVGGDNYTLSAPVTEGNVDTYTIRASDITGDIAIHVAKDLSVAVDVSEYVALDGKTMFLVTATGTPDEGSTLKYDGNTMFYSEEYGAYVWLVIVDNTATFDADTAKAKTSLAALGQGETVSQILYAGDVNMTDVIDVNDAQLVYNMYQAVYTDFDQVSMVKFLRADVNRSKSLTVEDAAAIISAMLKP